jgi:preprotein translocase subunit SecG
LISLTAQGAASFFSQDSTPGAVKSGLALLKASLILQVIFVVFVVLIVLVSRKRAHAQGIVQLDFEQSTYNFSGFFILLLIRDIFRTVQIFMPSDSMVWTQEAFFWVFDVVPMLAYTILLNWLHPGQHLLNMMKEERRAAAASPPPEHFDDVEVGAGDRMDKPTAIKLRPFSRDSY